MAIQCECVASSVALSVPRRSSVVIDEQQCEMRWRISANVEASNSW
jgi:hypothetical protein